MHDQGMRRVMESSATQGTNAPEGRQLGDILVAKGMATKAQIHACLEKQRLSTILGRPVPRLGELLVQQGIVTADQIREALRKQRVEIRYCPRCFIRVNVQIRFDVETYRCTRCQSPLVVAADGDDLTAGDEGFMVVSGEPMPPEVCEAANEEARRFAKFVILRDLGRGGVGVVNLAWDICLHEYVAVKRVVAMKQGDDPYARELMIASLIREGRHLVRLRHPGIVAVYDIGRVGDEVYLSMEYLEGKSLQSIIASSRKAGAQSPYFENPRRILSILSRVARAVQYAHTRPSPVIHCDLKPSNILMGPDGAPRVLDFGLARHIHEDPAGTEQIVGTPSYMAPEQAQGKLENLDVRTDVYGLGAILYELLTGRPPFVGAPFEVFTRTLSETPEKPSAVIREKQEAEYDTRRLLRIPPELEDLCMKCLERDREDRPATLEIVAEELERIHGLP